MAIISLVEDSPAMAKLIELKLTACGHDVTHYPDGQLGLEGVIEDTPEVLVLDVDLPFLNGFEVAEKIRDHAVIKELPILMLTGRSDVQSRVRGLEFADDYLSKPFSPDELLARIKSLVRRSSFSTNSSSSSNHVVVSVPIAPAFKVRNVKSLAGETIGQYTDLVEIGKGGMSIVYKALDTVLNRHVGLKFFTDLSDNQDMRERFKREAEVAATLNHGNICNVYTIDETEEGHPFMVMPFLDGENLEELLRKGPLKFEQSVNYICQVARGLASAHEAGIVHRDVKPANIFITKQGTVKLLDFGVAQWHHRNAKDQELTQPGSMLGTISYMAPEQVLSQPVDSRADIWSLGAVAFEMFSGVKPFANQGNILTSINAIVHDPLPKIEDHIPMVKPAIKQLLEKTLCKDPNGRYTNTKEILQELDSLSTQFRAENNGAKGEGYDILDELAEISESDLPEDDTFVFQLTENAYTDVVESFEDMPMIE